MHKGWSVTVSVGGGEAEVDIVFHDTDDAGEVRRSLIEHDGYDARIIVRPVGDSMPMVEWHGAQGRRFRGQ